MKKFFCTVLFCSLSLLFADSRLGADKAMPFVSEFLSAIPASSNSLYVLDENQTHLIIQLASDLHINVFELLDCSFRYAKPKKLRLRLDGEILRNLQKEFDLGGDRVLAILAIHKVDYLEIGDSFNKNQHDLDIYLLEPTETYIEIGTARYDTHFGFTKLSPLLFDGAFGINVKKTFFSSSLVKLKLYEPGKGEIYVKGLPMPKRWNLDVIATIR